MLLKILDKVTLIYLLTTRKYPILPELGRVVKEANITYSTIIRRKDTSINVETVRLYIKYTNVQNDFSF